MNIFKAFWFNVFIFIPMKRLLLFIALVAFANTQALAQYQTAIKRDAQAMCNAVVKGDFKTAVNYMYPKMVTQLGGRDKILQQVSDGAKAMNQAGQKLVNITIGEPGKVIANGNQRFVMVPSRVLVNVGGKVSNTSYPQLGISDDKGKTWHFMDGNNLNDDVMQRLFPKVGKQLIELKQAMGSK